MRPRQLLLRQGQFLVQGNVETLDLRITGSTITDIDSTLPVTKQDTVVPLYGLCVAPGLINSHDHLEFNLFPHLGTPPYRNYVDWSADIQKTHQKEIREILRVPLRLRLLWGAYKNIFSGVTTVVHHNPYYWQFRLGYPLEVYRPYQWIHSLRLEKRDLRKLLTDDSEIRFIHLAEGIDGVAQNEFTELKILKGLTKKTILIHGIGLGENDVCEMQSSSCGLIWCPASNDFLFGATAPIEKMLGKVHIALGTDSTLTGSLSLFEEMRAARRSKKLSAKCVVDMVTSWPAKMLGLSNREIRLGDKADLLMFQRDKADVFETILDLSAGSVGAVWKNGIPIFGDSKFAGLIPGGRRNFSTLEIEGQKKFVIGDYSSLVNRIRMLLPGSDIPFAYAS